MTVITRTEVRRATNLHELGFQPATWIGLHAQTAGFDALYTLRIIPLPAATTSWHGGRTMLFAPHTIDARSGLYRNGTKVASVGFGVDALKWTSPHYYSGLTLTLNAETSFVLSLAAVARTDNGYSDGNLVDGVGVATLTLPSGDSTQLTELRQLRFARMTNTPGEISYEFVASPANLATYSSWLSYGGAAYRARV